MSLPIKLISTDFDGTLHADFETPPVPHDLQELIGDLQRQGAKWAINTGRDLTGVMEGIARARLTIRPDYLVVVEREIYIHEGSQYVGSEIWNRECADAHKELFARVLPDMPQIVDWVNQRFAATIYEDPYSPFCLIAQNNGDADAIQAYLETYCTQVPNLAVVRNDIYARFSHVAYNKGTALAEIGRQLGISKEHTLAAGDHLNDLPMLNVNFARCLVAPDNAVPLVKEQVKRQNGYISHQPWGHGVARGLEFYLEQGLVSSEGQTNGT
ncbi:MAG: Haloacid dehalogenase domain protein hydrolase type 3 [Verrucomicrobiales bacterium]|nr:Haloacid dehalogenase domain protein hydrolase type 3 [Verrucomicrobiales bacterium]